LPGESLGAGSGVIPGPFVARRSGQVGRAMRQAGVVWLVVVLCGGTRIGNHGKHMAEERRHWRWWQKVGLGSALVLFTAIVFVCGLRKRWIKPLPGVRVAMSRPHVKESDLGPTSAYRLLLEAIEPPIGLEGPPNRLRVWHGTWQDATDKLATHPWPSEPPPPAPRHGNQTPAPKQAPPASSDMSEGSTVVVGLPADHPALAPDAPWTREQYEDVLRVLKLYEPKMAILDKALSAPNPQVPTAEDPAFEVPYLAPVRAMARWLSISAQVKAGMGDYAGSLRGLERCLGMGDLVTRGGVLVNRFVGGACSAIAHDAARRILTCRSIPASVLRDMGQMVLAFGDADEPYAETLRAQVAVDLGMVRMVYREGSLAGISHGNPPSAKERFLFRLARLGGSSPRNTQRNVEALHQHLITPLDRPYSATTEAEYVTLKADLLATFPGGTTELALRTRDPMGCILADFIIRLHGGGRRRLVEITAHGRGMALFCAIKAYEKEHGRIPDRLEELVPDYLPRVPKDPFDGKPFRYRKSNIPRLPAEAWAVYSIGPDFTDDGGTAYGIGVPSTNGHKNPDLVWPSHPYPPPPEREPEMEFEF
jgi:hypothetical protein